MAILRILSGRGDDGVEYDPAIEDERLERARRTFAGRVRAGYLAFVPDETGTGATHIRRFDRRAREIILQPPLAGG